MNLHADPDASLAMTAGFALFTAFFAALAAALYRPLFRRHADPADGSTRSDTGPR